MFAKGFDWVVISRFGRFCSDHKKQHSRSSKSVLCYPLFHAKTSVILIFKQTNKQTNKISFASSHCHFVPNCLLLSSILMYQPPSSYYSHDVSTIWIILSWQSDLEILFYISVLRILLNLFLSLTLISLFKYMLRVSQYCRPTKTF